MFLLKYHCSKLYLLMYLMYLAFKCEYIMNLWKTKLFTPSISTNTFHTKVTLNYPGCAREFKATLGKDLQTLGKALARRGTYKQIADAAFRCPSLKTCLITNTLQALGKECNDLCSRKTPSLLRKSGPDEMENFSFQKLCEEWKQRAPLFYSFLVTCATVKEKGGEWTPAMAIAGSALLKNRNVHMNATASLISVMVRQSATQVSFVTW